MPVRRVGSATGASSGARIVDIGNVRGLNEFRKALKAVGPEWPRALRGVHKVIADKGATAAQGFARGMGGVQAHFAAAIRGTANQREARVGLRAGERGPNVAFWGAKRHTGWFAAGRYHDTALGARQHPPWVGSDWDAAVAGQGPYAINAALAAHLPEFLDDYLDMVIDLASEAFS